MEGQTDGRMDGHGQTYIPPPLATNKKSDIKYNFIFFFSRFHCCQYRSSGTIQYGGRCIDTLLIMLHHGACVIT